MDAGPVFDLRSEKTVRRFGLQFEAAKSFQYCEGRSRVDPGEE
jgi:hypothetical protein